MFTVDEEENFCRVFELPSKQYPEGYCFDYGIKCTMNMVDWFKPVPSSHMLTHSFETWDDCKKALISFLKEKVYVKENKTYLVITDFGEAFTFKK